MHIGPCRRLRLAIVKMTRSPLLTMAPVRDMRPQVSTEIESGKRFDTLRGQIRAWLT